MELPDDNSLKILEERKNYLINKSQNKGNSYVTAEISVLDKTINFIKLIQNNFPDDILEKIITENELKNKNNNEDDDENNYKTLYSFDKNISKNLKLDISFTQYNGNKQIVLALKKYKRDSLKWAYQGKIITTMEILESIFKKADEIWKK